MCPYSLVVGARALPRHLRSTAASDQRSEPHLSDRPVEQQVVTEFQIGLLAFATYLFVLALLLRVAR
jgi:hypothetical protein